MSATPGKNIFWFIHYVWINALCSAKGGVDGGGGGVGSDVGVYDD